MSKVYVVRVCIISDQPVLLSGFARVLEQHDFEVQGFEVEGGLMQFVGEPMPRPDLAIFDITAGLSIEMLAQLNVRIPDCPVVLWANALPLDLIFRTLEFGVRGVVPRTAGPELLVHSLRRVASGEMQIGFGGPRDSAPSTRRQASLTPREREIVSRLRQGLRNKQIAAEMNITEGTVKIYLFRLFHKLGVRSRFELASCYAGSEQSAGPRLVESLM